MMPISPTVEIEPSEVVQSCDQTKNGIFCVEQDKKQIVISDFHERETHLLHLPAELRAMIWEYALSDNTIRPTFRNDGYPAYNASGERRKFSADGFRPAKHRFSLLAVCRQIHNEAADLVWSLSTFRFHTSFDLSFWLKRTPVSKLNLIRRIEHGERQCIWIQTERWMHNLRCLPNVDSFEVNLCTRFINEGDVVETQECFDMVKTQMEGERKMKMSMVVLPKKKMWTDIFRNEG